MTEDLAKILLSYIPGWDQYKVIQREMSSITYVGGS